MSLKSVLPRLARTLDMNTATLYERQRALTRAGLLESRPGRGPGSGVPVDASSLAMLLTSLLATSSLAETEEWTRIVAQMPSTERRCPITRKTKFVEAFAAALPLGLSSAEVERSSAKLWAMGALTIGWGRNQRVSDFEHGQVPPPVGMSVKTTLWENPLKEARNILAEQEK